ncbi:pilin glycosylation ligase domain-containing protein [Aquabacterium sp. OR-4]|uniref:pilin glycosylation ligase domain-containing protein n=1 Tax=Aquabacterium sp. OR-4 TaxID=2978127 RepID=UPI0028C84F56|nr:pilin glycosylation ligase domain-containing protein [Aquabacterium sp. OR-4]MDT7833921.1 pilin glycosylation ligase domain-containing protein [Aquabacterium sp. OR-4]
MRFTRPRPLNPANAAPEGWPVAAMAAIALPLLFSYELPPAHRTVQQCLSVLGWGLCLMLAARLNAGHRRAHWPLPAALGALLLAALASVVWLQAARAPALTSAGLLLVALLVADAGHRQAQGARAQACFEAVCAAILLAARLNAVIGIVQLALPLLPDLPMLATTRVPGRATGNLRQANQLASLMLWGLVATAHLHGARAGTRRGWVLAIDAVLLSAALALSGSRWGLAGLALLAAWALLDRCASPALRRGLAIAAAACLATALLGLWLSEHGAQASGLAARLQADTGPDAGRNGRWPLWQAAWSLALQHPWTGVGWGQFNLAWSLQPVAHRGTALFNHAHNLPLQLWAEMGLLAGSAVLAMLGLALARLLRRCIGDTSPQGAMRRSCWLFMLVMLGHSLLEFPLWHAYFLLPSVWLLAFGLATEPNQTPEQAPGPARHAGMGRIRLGLALACVMAGAAALLDYLHLTHAPLPADARGRPPSSSLLFAHVADHRTARETAAVDPPVLRSALAFLVDPVLLDRWATHLETTGRIDDAWAVRRRLHELASRTDRSATAPLPDCPGDHRADRWRELLALAPGARRHETVAAGAC